MSLTTVADTLLNIDTTPRVGTVTFIATRLGSNGSGLVPASSSVSAVLDGSGAFSVQLTPTSEYDSETYYQLWFKDSVTRVAEFIGLYQVPVSANTETLSVNQVVDTDLNVTFVFASEATVRSLISAIEGFTPTSPAQITSDKNNYAPGNSYGPLRLNSDASRTITGMSLGRDGILVWIWNVGSNNIIFANQSGSSTANKRFACSTGADITLGAGQLALAMYDGTTQRWRLAKVS